MGGAYTTAHADGARCQFQSYWVDPNFRMYDTGFRCCFTSNPTL